MKSVKAKGIAIGLVVLGLFWLYLAFESYARGKLGISLLQGVAGLAFGVRGVMDWLKHSAVDST